MRWAERGPVLGRFMEAFAARSPASPTCARLASVPSGKVLPQPGTRSPAEFAQRVPDVARKGALSPPSPQPPPPAQGRGRGSLADICRIFRDGRGGDWGPWWGDEQGPVGIRPGQGGGGRPPGEGRPQGHQPGSLGGAFSLEAWAPTPLSQHLFCSLSQGSLGPAGRGPGHKVLESSGCRWGS